MDRCGDIDTELTTAEALAIIEPYFFVVRDRFYDAGYSELRRTKLRCRKWVHDTPRHFAACTDDGSEIVVAPELAELGYDTVCAMLAHELGHATDFCYPARFILSRDGRSVGTVPEVDMDDVAAAREWRQWLGAWKRRDTDTVELTADGIAEEVMGTLIGYRGPCLLQSFAGRPRPLGLR